MGGGMYAGRALAATALALLLSACATPDGAFPSLARRDAERVAGTINPSVATPAMPPLETASPSPAARLDQIEARARAGHARFQSRESRARGQVSAARGAAVASESWSVATVAVAELEAARSQVMIALADLDALYAAERVSGGDATPIALARERVTALVVQEDAVLAKLGTALRD